MNPFRDIPEHDHTHSVFTRCLDCFMWGIDMPKKFIDASECGNCQSMNTVKYYPPCCILADRELGPKACGEIQTVWDFLDPFDWDE